MLTVKILGNNESVGRIFIYLFMFFYLLYLTQMHSSLALFITSIDLIPIKKQKLKLLTAAANLSFLYFERQTRSTVLDLHHIPSSHSAYFDRAFSVQGPKLWNSLTAILEKEHQSVGLNANSSAIYSTITKMR